MAGAARNKVGAASFRWILEFVEPMKLPPQICKDHLFLLTIKNLGKIPSWDLQLPSCGKSKASQRGRRTLSQIEGQTHTHIAGDRDSDRNRTLMACSSCRWGDGLCGGSWLSWGWGWLQVTGGCTLLSGRPDLFWCSDSSRSLLKNWLCAPVSQKWKPPSNACFPLLEMSRVT